MAPLARLAATAAGLSALLLALHAAALAYFASQRVPTPYLITGEALLVCAWALVVGVAAQALRARAPARLGSLLWAAAVLYTFGAYSEVSE